MCAVEGTTGGSGASQALWIAGDHEFQMSDTELYTIGPWFNLNVSVP